MSMIGNFVAVSGGQLRNLIDDPSALSELVMSEDDGLPRLDVDKAWHGLHFLLTGEAWSGAPPLGLAVLGGDEIGDDLGYGPARFLRPPDVAAVAEALSTVTRDQLAARYVPTALETAEIYPTGIWADEGEEALDYLLEYFDQLVGFYRAAAARGDGVILYLG